MLLSCCFRDSGFKEHKKQKYKNKDRKDSGSFKEDLLLREENFQVKNTKAKLDQEKYPLSKDKKLAKQLSRERKSPTECRPMEHDLINSLPDPPKTPPAASVTSSSDPSIVFTLQCPESINVPGEAQSSNNSLIHSQPEENVDIVNEQLLQEAVEEMKRNHELHLANLRAEHERDLEAVNRDHMERMNNIRKETLMENEIALSQAKISTEETIKMLNEQFEMEKEDLSNKQNELINKLQNEYKEKEEKLQQSFTEIEERDKAWQEERAEILKEIQRLKEEATKIMKILAMEFEEEFLTEERKNILGQEVNSLQLVVEMRTQEVKSLKEQLEKASQELEASERIRERLKFESEKVQKLENQLEQKSTFERQISVENSQLEAQICSSNKAVERMSQNVEELQWKIRNHFQFGSDLSPNPNNSQASFKTFCDSLLRNYEDTSPETSIAVPEPPPVKQETYPQLTAAVEEKQGYKNDKEENLPTSNEGVVELVIEEGGEAEAEDLDSFDEGLGDTSSDETAESPIPTSQSHQINEEGRRTSRVSLETSF